MQKEGATLSKERELVSDNAGVGDGSIDDGQMSSFCAGGTGTQHCI